MAKDYKSSGKEKPAKKSGGVPGVIWMLGGFVLGVVVTVLYRVGTPVVPAKPVVASVPPTAAPANAPATDFTYHDILGGLEIVVPGQIKSEKPTTAKPSAVYTLQVGAFRTAPEADRLRAQLALIGVEAKIQKSTVDDKDTWFRVRVGPIKDEAELEKVRARLTENNIKSMLVRGSA